MASVNGVNKVIADIRAFGREAEKRISQETEAIAFQIEADAKRNAPKNFGKLAQSISHEKINASNYKVTVNEFYGAYVEFGTGKMYKPHPEWDHMAAQFKGPTGRPFSDFVEAMKIWMRAKGYDESNAWIACINVLKNGQEAQPFLYPAYVKGRKDYEKNLKQLLKNLKRNI